jgi:CO/xanthine dehydrogenase FAD-binding subunit
LSMNARALKKKDQRVMWAEIFTPKTLKEILTILERQKGRTALIAGGTNVIPDMRAKALKPDVLIDLSHLKNLSYIKEEKKRIRIGSLTTIAELASSRIIQKYAPILSQAADQLGNPLVRNRATIGGNLADASPAADTAVPLLALEAMVVTEKDGGKRRQIPINKFFTGSNKTVLKADEIIKEIFFRKPNSDAKMGYLKLGRRNAMAISVVSLAIRLEMEKGKCKKARISLGAVAPTPIRAYGTEEMLVGREVTKQLIEGCCNEITKEVNPITDIRASAEYRKEMASVLLRRLLQQIADGS